jgi:hypothetical protein
VSRRFWAVAGAFGLVALAVLLVVSFVAASTNNARITRMKDHGIPVVVTVSDCIGNLGGSGSNATNYTCSGHYAIAGTPYREVVGAMTAFAPPGTHVRALADPSRPSTIELTTAVAWATASASAYAIPGALSLAFVALCLVFFRLARAARK